MRALTLDFSTRKLGVREVPEPRIERANDVLLRIREVGVCATDRELAAFRFGSPPDDCAYLVPGHEAVGQILKVGSGVTAFNAGDWAVPTVRRGCQPACAMCARGRADFCITGRYTESGLVGRHGFWQEKIVEEEADLVRIPIALVEFGVLVEPLSVVEKAVNRAIEIHPGGLVTTLVVGAGTVGALTALVLQLRGVDVTVLSAEPADHPRAEWVRGAGMTYLRQLPGGARFDLIVEACGSATAALSALTALAPLGVMAILGARDGSGPVPFLQMLVHNQAIFGSVNAAQTHYRAAVEDLARMDATTLRGMVERRPFIDYARSFAEEAGAAPKIIHTMERQTVS